MAASVWPVGLPQEQFMNTSFGSPESTIVSRTTIGPGKTRQLATTGVVKIDVPIVLDGADMSTFLAFYKTTLLNGSQPFDWFDPISGATVDYRFAVGDAYRFTVVKGGSPQIWRGVLHLEIIPT